MGDFTPSLLHLCAELLQPYVGSWGQGAILLVGVALFHLAMKRGMLALKQWFERGHAAWVSTLLTALYAPLLSFFWFVALLCVLDALYFSFLDTHLSYTHSLIDLGGILAGSWFLYQWKAKVVEGLLSSVQAERSSLSLGTLDLLSKLGTVAIGCLTLFLLLDATGRNMQAFLTFSGIGGLALAFSSQQVVANFFGGLMVYVTQPFTIGEWVNLPEKGIEGHIEEIGWYMTRIRNFDKRPIYIPNSVFTQTVVMTPSRMSHERFFHKIGLRYRDIHVVQPILESIRSLLQQHPAVDHHLPIDVFLKNFGPVALDIEVSAYVAKGCGTRFSSVREELLIKIAAIIANQGAEIATPAHLFSPQESKASRSAVSSS